MSISRLNTRTIIKKCPLLNEAFNNSPAVLSPLFTNNYPPIFATVNLPSANAPPLIPKERRYILNCVFLHPAINRDEAIKIAAESFKENPGIESVEYITTTNGLQEYREKPLPARAITFKHATATTVYVSAQFGKVESFRNNKWRVFDFLWMMHTMDYKQRDNLNNWLLRAFSIFGLLTIRSGFVLYFISCKRFKIRNDYYSCN